MLPWYDNWTSMVVTYQYFTVSISSIFGATTRCLSFHFYSGFSQSWSNWTLHDAVQKQQDIFAQISPFLDRPTGLSWWCGSWSRAGRRESWPSPSQVGVDHEPRAPPCPRRSSAASGGVAATPGSPETKFTIRHVGCYFPFNMQIHAWSNHVMVCQKSRLNYAAKILVFMQSSWKRKHEVSLVGDCFGLDSPLPLHC